MSAVDFASDMLSAGREAAEMAMNSPADVLNNISSGHNVTSLAAAGGLIIEFYTPRQLTGPILFPAFLTSFSDKVTANFNDTTVYARMDPIYSYQNTVRDINFSFDVMAYDEYEASDNLEKIKVLQQLLYPTYYSTGDGIDVLTTPPLFQIKFGNLIEDQGGHEGRLLGIIDSFDYSPSLDMGMFTSMDAESTMPRQDGLPNENGNGPDGMIHLGGHMLPKAYNIDVSFKPIHSEPRGWRGNEFTGGSVDVGARPARGDNMVPGRPITAVASALSTSASSGVMPTTEEEISQHMSNDEIFGSGW